MSAVCPKCGTIGEEGALFCIKCGTRLDGGQNAQPQNTGSQSIDPQYRYYPNFPQQEQPSKKKTGLTIGIVIGAVILFFVLLGSFMIFVLPDLIANPDNYSRPTESHPEGYHTHADYSKISWSELPYGDEDVMKDFSYTDGWKTMTGSAKRIYDFESIVGFWKAVMITEPEKISGTGASYDYFNVEIYGMADDANMIFNWDRRVDVSTGKTETLRGAGTKYSGTFKNGAISAENGNIAELTSFWTDGDKQYAVGKFTWSNGEIGYIGLVRGKTE